MENNLPDKTDLIFLRKLQNNLAVENLDDLFEIVLSHLLHIPHIRRAEIHLFDKQDKLVRVATGENSGLEGHTAQKIRSHSWAIDSAVSHSTRRVKAPTIFFSHSFPLLGNGQPLGVLTIQVDHISINGSELINRLTLISLQLSSLIKQLLLTDEIEELKEELGYLTADSRDNQQRMTALSKELYAITAISTKINQSMDLKKSLHKSMLKIKEVFRSSAVLVFLRNPRGSRNRLSAIHMKEDHLAPALLKNIEKSVLENFVAPPQPKDGSPVIKAHYLKQIDLFHDQFKSLIGAPMKSQKKFIGALIILQTTVRPFEPDDLRLLSGIANIMGMAVENMNLFRQSQQNKKEAAFLIGSMSTFNQKLELEKTLTAVVEKGAEFIGPHGQVFLFSETKIPMIQYCKAKTEPRASIRLNTFARIHPKALKSFYTQMILQKRPLLIRDTGRSKKLTADAKVYFLSNKIRSILAVPLKLTHQPLGLLLLGRQTGGRIFEGHDFAVVEALCAAASVAIENARVHSASIEMSEFFERKIGETTSEIEKIQEIQKLRVENRKDVIFRVNKSGRFVFVNKAMENLTGLSREELYRSDTAEEVVAEEDRKRVRNGFRQMLNGERPLIRDLVFRHRDRRGEDHFISLTIYPEKDQLGRITGIEGVGRDITEKKQLKREIEKTRILALLGEFSSAIAHQIRNPLGNILVGTKLLQKALRLNEDHVTGKHAAAPNLTAATDKSECLSETFNNLFDGIYNLNQVVTELVEYTKTLKLRHSCQRIETILEETLAMFKELIARNDIRVNKNYDPALPPLSVDAVLMSQVFQNMVHNAIQAMPSGGFLTVATGPYLKKPGCALITISDTGVGIQASDMEKIFNPFYTTKDSGTGLGLSLAHRIVEAHGGNAWVCRNPCAHLGKDFGKTSAVAGDRGITFHIVLPISDPAPRSAYSQEN
ncbi:MAG: ATP-binding protein [Desulfobacterales bacterium]